MSWRDYQGDSQVFNSPLTPQSGFGSPSTLQSGFGSPSTPQSRLNSQYVGLCDCNLPPVRKTSLTRLNYGRRFWGCSRYPKDDAKTIQWYEQHPDEKKPWCGFFLWCDDDFNPQAKAWLTRCWEKEQKMLEKEKTLMTEVLEVKKENLDLHRELHVLKNSYSELERKAAELEKRTLQKNFSWLNLRNCMALCICTFAFWFFCLV